MLDGMRGGGASPALQPQGVQREEEKRLDSFQKVLSQKELQDRLTPLDKKRVRLASKICQLGIDNGIKRLLIDSVSKSLDEGSTLSELMRIYGYFTCLAEVRLQVKDYSEAELVLSTLDEFGKEKGKRPVLEMLTHLSIASWSPQTQTFLIGLLNKKKALAKVQALTCLQVSFQYALSARGAGSQVGGGAIVFDEAAGWLVEDPPAYIQWDLIDCPDRNLLLLSTKPEMADFWTKATVLRLEFWRPFGFEHVADQLMKELRVLQSFISRSFDRLQSLSLSWAGPCVLDTSLIGNLRRLCLDVWVDPDDRGLAWTEVVKSMTQLTVLELAVNKNFRRTYMFEMVAALRQLRILRVFFSCTNRGWLRNQTVKAPWTTMIEPCKDTMCPLEFLLWSNVDNLQVLELRGAWRLAPRFQGRQYGVLKRLSRSRNLQSCIITLPTRGAKFVATALATSGMVHKAFPPWEASAFVHVQTHPAESVCVAVSAPIAAAAPGTWPVWGRIPVLAHQVLLPRVQARWIEIGGDWLESEHKAWMLGSKVFRHGVQEPAP